MRPLRYYQETFFFFSVVLLLAAAVYSQIEFRVHPSYPLPAQTGPAIEADTGLDHGAVSPTQKDGGPRVTFHR